MASIYDRRPNPYAHLQPVEFSADESRVTVGGHRFIASTPPIVNRCRGCAFIDGLGCAVIRKDKGSMCTPGQRQDRMHIIWKLDT